jgi:integrase
MAPVVTGSLTTRTLADGTRSFQLRFRVAGRRARDVLHERAGCECGCGGGWDERAARYELANIQARVRAGVWQPRRPKVPRVSKSASAEVPTFHSYASEWRAAKTAGLLGDRPIDPHTQADYRWRLSAQVLPYFAAMRLDEIDRETCLAFKAHKLREASEQRAALAAGARLTDRRGRGRVPLGPNSLHKIIYVLAAILDDAVEDGYIAQNPARSRRMRVHVPKPARTFLEADELLALIDAAQEQDAALPDSTPDPGLHGTAAAVARRFARGQRPGQIARELHLSKGTISYHLGTLGLSARHPYAGRRAVAEILARSGVRASELCDLRWGDVRLHDPTGTRFHIRDSRPRPGCARCR